MSVGAVWSQMPAAERRRAYACDITYGTLREFAFDHLKERLAQREAAARGGTAPATGCGRELLGLPDPEDVALLLDECDSLLIDEARTPFLISAAGAPPTPPRRAASAGPARSPRRSSGTPIHPRSPRRSRRPHAAGDRPGHCRGGPAADGPAEPRRDPACRRAGGPRQRGFSTATISTSSATARSGSSTTTRGGSAKGGGGAAGVQQAIEARENLVLSPDGRTEGADYGAGLRRSLRARQRHDRHRAGGGWRVLVGLWPEGRAASSAASGSAADGGRHGVPHAGREVGRGRGGGPADPPERAVGLSSGRGRCRRPRSWRRTSVPGDRARAPERPAPGPGRRRLWPGPGRRGR